MLLGRNIEYLMLFKNSAALVPNLPGMRVALDGYMSALGYADEDKEDILQRVIFFEGDGSNAAPDDATQPNDANEAETVNEKRFPPHTYNAEQFIKYSYNDWPTKLKELMQTLGLNQIAVIPYAYHKEEFNAIELIKQNLNQVGDADAAPTVFSAMMQLPEAYIDYEEHEKMSPTLWSRIGIILENFNVGNIHELFGQPYPDFLPKAFVFSKEAIENDKSKFIQLIKEFGAATSQDKVVLKVEGSSGGFGVVVLHVNDDNLDAQMNNFINPIEGKLSVLQLQEYIPHEPSTLRSMQYIVMIDTDGKINIETLSPHGSSQQFIKPRSTEWVGNAHQPNGAHQAQLKAMLGYVLNEDEIRKILGNSTREHAIIMPGGIDFIALSDGVIKMVEGNHNRFTGATPGIVMYNELVRKGVIQKDCAFACVKISEEQISKLEKLNNNDASEEERDLVTRVFGIEGAKSLFVACEDYSKVVKFLKSNLDMQI